MAQYLIALLNFELAIYTLKLIRATNDLVKTGIQPQEMVLECQQEGSFPKTDLEFYVDFTGRHDSPSDLQDFVQSVRQFLTGDAEVAIENEISYYEQLLKEPTIEKAGEELWRIGLIPYLSPVDDFRVRLQLNRKCMDKLARPSRPQMSISERIESIYLKPNTIQWDLFTLLTGKSLQSDTGWLKEILNPIYRDVLAFDKWIFPSVESTNLQLIEVEDFVDDTGKVTRYCKLKQPDGPDTELRAECGAGKVYMRQMDN